MLPEYVVLISVALLDFWRNSGARRASRQAVRHLRRSFSREHPDTEHEFENIFRAIYATPIFSTATPAQVGTAYQTACETG